MSREVGHASPAPADSITWGKLVWSARRGLRGLALGLVPHGEVVTILLENRGPAPLEVLRDDVTLVLDGSDHYQWYTNSGGIRSRVTLAPGDRYSFDIDLHARAHRIVDPMTGAEAIAPGVYAVRVSYEWGGPATYHPGDERMWLGRIDAGPVTVEIR